MEKEQKKKIIFVCSGNTCRSPMAEALLKQELKKRKITCFSVSSAGIHTNRGDTLHPFSRKVLDEIGCPVSASFKSRKLTKRSIESAWLIIPMTEEIGKKIGVDYAYTMKQLSGYEIPDPYGKEIEFYRYCLDLLRMAIPIMLDKIVQ